MPVGALGGTRCPEVWIGRQTEPTEPREPCIRYRLPLESSRGESRGATPSEPESSLAGLTQDGKLVRCSHLLRPTGWDG